MVAAVAYPQVESKPAPMRQDTTERWQRASERAAVANVVVTLIEDDDLFRVTSASHPDVRYESDGVHCTCLAYANGDPVCLHRAAVRDHLAARAALGIELLAAKAALNKIDDELAPFNADLEYGDGTFSHRNRRRHGHLLYARELAQQRVWDAQDALGQVQNGKVAA